MPLMLALVMLPLLAKVWIAATTSENFGWPVLNYHIGYETGFGGRKLIGTLCHLLMPSYIKARHIRHLVMVANFVLMALFVWMVARVARMSANSRHVALMVLIYLVGPFSLLSWFDTGLSTIFMETYQLVLTLGWLLAYLRWHGHWQFLLTTLLVAVTCCLIHHTFCCTLFPLFVALLFYDLMQSYSLPRLLWTGVILLAMATLLVAIWLFSHMNLPKEELLARIASHAAPDAYECNPDVVDIMYYKTNSENRLSNIYSLTHALIPQMGITLLLLSPLLAVLYWPWMRAIHLSSSRREAWSYRLVMLSTLLVFPIFFAATDYSRWWVCWFFVLSMLILTALARRDQHVETAVAELYAFFRTHHWVLILLVAYLLGMHTEGIGGLKEAINLQEFLMRLTA